MRSVKSILAIMAIILVAAGCSLGNASAEKPNYSAHPEAREFISEMVQRHDFDTAELEKIFSSAQRRDDILELMRKPAEKRLTWDRYRKIFLTRSRIEGGAAFWSQHAGILARAEQEFAVDAQLIVAIIGVETHYGNNTGSHRVIDALSTLAFDYPPRSKFFRGELEQFLVLAREEDINLLETRGSYAGAMGYGQFIPSSYRSFAVDFDKDGKRDLWDSPNDIIGSVANYMQRHHWSLGDTVAAPVTISPGKAATLPEPELKPSHTVAELKAAGMQTDQALADDAPATVIKLETGNGFEYWMGLENFYTITRYNHSPLYAMAVYQLSEEIRETYEQSLNGADE
jgi:membrane-bound lytic murein transglycosylase B